jgi:hypothetical protein
LSVRGAVAIALASLLASTPLAAAQDESEQASAPAAERRPDQLDPSAPLTLRPQPRLRSLAQGVARVLALRAHIEVTVGDAAPPEVLEAVPTAHVALGREGPEVVVVLAGPRGLVYGSRLDLPGSRDAAVRAVALAIDALRDAAIEGPPPAPESGDEGGGGADEAGPGGRRVRYVLIEPEGGIFYRSRRHEPTARPTIYLRALIGFSTARNTALIGPGVGVGLCADIACVVIEGDLPVLPDERRTNVGMERIFYRPVSLSMRGQLRPFRWGDFVPAITAGVLTRFGSAWIEPTETSPGVSQLVTDFGVRATLEIAWIFAAPFEWVVELGVDVAVNPARFVRYGEEVLLEDIVTLWGVTSLRLRP